MSRSSHLKQVISKGRYSKNLELILWIVPAILVLLSSVLIASTQRHGFHLLFYQHLITGAFGVVIALIFFGIWFYRLLLLQVFKNWRFHIYRLLPSNALFSLSFLSWIAFWRSSTPFLYKYSRRRRACLLIILDFTCFQNGVVEFLCIIENNEVLDCLFFLISLWLRNSIICHVTFYGDLL